MRAIVFAGPSLPLNVALPVAGLDRRPPVRQGDVYRAALTNPDIIVIVDGYFEVTPTVWHKEILWAMAQGIHVYGAASIGALRAAELDVFGMKGVGRIYEMYRDEVLQDDEEVAVLHGPEELGYPSVTEAMVNVRATLDVAKETGVLDAHTAVELTAIAKSLFYKQRTYEAVLDAANVRGFPRSTLCRFSNWLQNGRVDQKRLDACATLEVIKQDLTRGFTPMRVSYRFANTSAWEKVAQSGEAG